MTLRQVPRNIQDKTTTERNNTYNVPPRFAQCLQLLLVSDWVGRDVAREQWFGKRRRRRRHVAANFLFILRRAFRYY